METQRYALRPDLNVWCVPDVKTSTGDPDQEAELARLRAILNQTGDTSVDSEELLSRISDWPTRFCFSPERANAVRPLACHFLGRVLEIGADGGAITRFLGEVGGQVVALEPNLQKAAVAAARCRGLENVTVICDRPDAFTASEPFHCIILAGALEQSPLWMGAADPVAALLERCHGWLANGGVLILALDNQLGLKYFAGSPEEHTGRIFQTISGSADPYAPKSLGKGELEKYLAAAGFRHSEFLYPLPDYRHARLLLHEAAFHDPDLNLTDLIRMQAASHDQRRGFVRLFSERRAWDVAVRNGVAEELANSFVVVAAASKPDRPYLSRETLVHSFSVVRRRYYQKVNNVVRQPDGLSVHRAALSRDPAPQDGPCRQEICNERFLEGKVYANLLYDRLDTPGWKFADLVEWVSPYYQFLKMHGECSDSGVVLLPENYLDCTPFNLMLGADGSLTPFDLEWLGQRRPALRFVLFRGLLYTLGGLVTIAPPGEALDLGVLNLTLRMFGALGETVPDTAGLEEFFLQEDVLQKAIVGNHASLSRQYWHQLRLAIRPDQVLEASLRDGSVSPFSGERLGMQETIERLTSKARTYEEMLRDRDGQITFLTSSVSEAREQARQLKDELDKTQESLLSLEHEVNMLRRVREGAAEEIAALSGRISRMTATAETLQEIIADRDNQITRLVGVIADRDAAINRLSDVITEARNAGEALLEAREREIGSLRDRVARIPELESELQSSYASYEQVRARLAEQAEQVEGFRAEIGGLRAEIGGLRAELGRQREVAAAQREQADSLSASLAVREQHISDLAGEIKGLRGAAVAYQNRIADLQRSEAEHKSEVAQLQTELSGMRKSYAWELGVLLRFLEASLRAFTDRLVGLIVIVRYALLALPGRRVNIRRWMALIDQSGCFDVDYYLRNYPDVARMRINARMHYLVWGAREHRSPNPLFDVDYYIKNRPEAGRPGCNPLVDYIEHGARQSVNPHPLFDTAYYLRHNPDVAAAGCNPLAHYLAHGAAERRNPHPLVDSSYYLDRAPDVHKSGASALLHYLQFGATEGRDPHFLFDTSYYLKTNPDVAGSGVNPLVHYVRRGALEGRSPHPVFDVSYYLEQAADRGAAHMDPLLHYLKWGMPAGINPHPLFEIRYYLEQAGPDAAANPLLHYFTAGAVAGLDPHPLFDTSYYLAQVPEISAQGVNPLVHYIEHGGAAGLDPHPLFASSFYLQRYPEVAACGMNPLVHYARHGAWEQRDPHPLFHTSFYLEHYPEAAEFPQGALIHFITEGAARQYDPHPLFCSAYYLAQNPYVQRTGLNPLLHYVQVGMSSRKNPHPLFDNGYYLDHNPDAVRSGMNALMHYLWHGSQHSSPHPLFQTFYYLQSNPDIGRPDCDPLIHFLQYGGFEGRNPHPLFHCGFYLKQYPEVASRQINPLVDYIQEGAQTGRDPNPMFDTSFYLEQNPDVAASGLNPLVHYVQDGGFEGRDPHPEFNTAQYVAHYPEVARERLNPLEHYLEKDCPVAALAAAESALRRDSDTIAVRELSRDGEPPGAPDFPPAKTILCLSHVAPCPPRAGNEYRIYRMLRHLQNRGYRVVLFLAPLGGEGLTDERFLDVAREFPNLLLCNTDTELVYHLETGCSVMAELHGRKLESFAQVLDEDARVLGVDQPGLDRGFCHDFLIQVVSHLRKGLGPCVLLSEYIFMSRLMPLMGPDTLKIVDTHDVFSSKKNKVIRFGIEDTLSLTAEQERVRLLRADVVLAIQGLEEKELAALVPERKVIKAAVDFDVVASSGKPASRRILYVASDNSMNVKGLREFLRFAWPLIRQEVPDAELHVAGRVAQTVHTVDPRVHLLGMVDRISPLYQEAKVTINPSVAGTGLKIKNLEAICHFRPVVTWPSGVDGMEPGMAEACLLAEDWYHFSQQVIRVLLDPRPEWISPEHQEEIRKSVKPDAVYKRLCQEIEQFYQQATRDNR